MIYALSILLFILAILVYAGWINARTWRFGITVLRYDSDTTANVLAFYDKYFNIKDYNKLFWGLFWSGGRWKKVLPAEAHEYFQKTLNHATLMREFKKCSRLFPNKGVLRKKNLRLPKSAL